MARIESRVELLRVALSRALRGFPGLGAAWLYGSVLVGGRPRDVDVAVWLFEPSDAWARLGVAEEIGRVLDRLPAVRPLCTDVRALNEAPLSFRYRVVHEGVPLDCGCRDFRVGFEARTMVEWFDFRPVWEACTDGFLQRVADAG